MNGNLQLMRDPRFIMRIKDADETVNNSNVLQDDADLYVTTLPTGRYAFTMLLKVTSGLTPDWKYSLAAGSGATFTGFGIYTTPSMNLDYRDLSTASVSMVLGSSTNCFFWTGFILVTVEGSFKLQWAQNTADASDTKVLEGSWMKLEKL